MAEVKVKWLGHACFKLTYGEWSAVIDPYEDGSVDGIKNVRETADCVFCSHGHHDHNAVSCVDIKDSGAEPPFIKSVMTCHDNENGTKRGSNIVRIFDFSGIKIAHFGDLGHILNEEQVKEIGNVDVALMPMGGFYTVNASDAHKVLEQVNAKIAVPMHYRTDRFGFPVISHIDDIIKEFDKVVVTESYELTISENTERGVYVLTPALVK